MKIERISDNQIHRTLASSDLSVRSLNLGELVYGSEKARSLFRETIRKASNEVGSEAEDIPLMIEVTSLSNESATLVITKIEDPEKLDTRFARFSPMSEEDSDSFPDLASELLEGVGGLSNLLSDNTPFVSEDLESPDRKMKASRMSSTRVYTSEDSDRTSEAARAVGDLCQGQNTLYKKSGTLRHFLVLTDDGSDLLDFNRVCSILAEYGTKIHHEYSSESYYWEYYEAVVRNCVLQTIVDI